MSDRRGPVVRNTFTDEAIQCVTETELRAKCAPGGIRIRKFGPRCGLVWEECGHAMLTPLNVQLQEEEPVEEEEGPIEEEETPSQTGLKFNVPQALR